MGKQTQLVPFGKYRGQPAEVLQNDPDYVDWMLNNTDLRVKHPSLHTLIINNFTENKDTPDHNRMQVRFLDDDYVYSVFRHAAGVIKPAPATIGLQRFEQWYHEAVPILENARDEQRQAVEDERLKIETRINKLQQDGLSDSDYLRKCEKKLQERLEQLESVAEPKVNIDAATDAEDGTLLGFSMNYRKLVLDDIHRDKIYCRQVTILEFDLPSVAVSFETKQGWDVVAVASGNTPKSCQHLEWPDLFIELKPSVGDDYPEVLRQIKGRYKDTGIRLLIVDDFVGIGASELQVRQIFEREGIVFLLSSEIQQVKIPAFAFSVDSLEKFGAVENYVQSANRMYECHRRLKYLGEPPQRQPRQPRY